MGKVQRYDMKVIEEYEHLNTIEPDNDGDFVLYADYRALEAERDSLAAWKKEQLAVEATWDCQAVGRLLGVKWGADIRSQIQPGIEALEAEKNSLRESIYNHKDAISDREIIIYRLERKLAALVEAAEETLKYVVVSPYQSVGNLKAAIDAAKEGEE